MRCEFDALKLRLDDYREAEKDIEHQNERLDLLVTRMAGVGAQVLTDLPRSPSPPTDRISDMLHKKQELEDELREMLAAHKEERQWIESVLHHLRKADERAVVRFRYIDVMSWNTVNDAMFGGKEDFLDKEETYLRRAHKVHDRALQNMVMYLDSVKATSRQTTVPGAINPPLA